MAEKNRRKPPRARVEAIVARNAATAVIFRHGPSRFVRMLAWNLRNDRIEPGQWIDARVHVDRCDLAPGGQLVACFVGSYRRAPGTWTAISRPPYFTALAVWPKGDTWGGGGLFVSDDHFLLEHDTRIQYGVDQFKLLSDFSVPKRFRLQGFRDHSPVPMGDIEQTRMVLAGWRFIQRHKLKRRPGPKDALNHPCAEPEIMARVLDDPRHPRFEVRRFVDGHGPRRWQTSFRIMRAQVHDLKQGAHRDLGYVDWVDADHKGDVLWSQQGRLFRLRGPTRQGMRLDAAPKLVAGLNAMVFETIEPPRAALR
jgi:hypothetical protein